METDIVTKLEHWAESGITHKIYSTQITSDLFEAVAEIQRLRRLAQERVPSKPFQRLKAEQDPKRKSPRI